MATGKPVSDAFISPFKEISKTLGVRQLGPRVKTNARGVARFTVERTWKSKVVVVEVGSRLTVVRDIRVDWIRSDTISDFLYFDRKLLQPNETLYVKGKDIFRPFLHILFHPVQVTFARRTKPNSPFVTISIFEWKFTLASTIAAAILKSR